MQTSDRSDWDIPDIQTDEATYEDRDRSRSRRRSPKKGLTLPNITPLHIVVALVVVALASLLIYQLFFYQRAAALVNGEKITIAQLDDAVAQVRSAQTEEEGMDESESDDGALRAILLDDLIEQRLLAQEADRIDLDVSDEEVDTQIDAMRKSYPDDLSFETFLNDSGYTIETVTAKRRADLIVERLLEAEVPDESVSTEEVLAYFYDHPDAFGGEGTELTAIIELQIHDILVNKARNAAFDSLVARLRTDATIVIKDPTVLAYQKSLDE